MPPHEGIANAKPRWHEADVPTALTYVRYWGKPDNKCSTRAFPVLTQSGHQAASGSMSRRLSSILFPRPPHLAQTTRLLK